MIAAFFSMLGPASYQRPVAVVADGVAYLTAGTRVLARSRLHRTRPVGHADQPDTFYMGSVGGGVWKTTNCCSSATTWTVTTDDALVSTTNIDSLTIDPNDHNAEEVERLM